MPLITAKADHIYNICLCVLKFGCICYLRPCVDVSLSVSCVICDYRSICHLLFRSYFSASLLSPSHGGLL